MMCFLEESMRKTENRGDKTYKKISIKNLKVIQGTIISNLCIKK